MKTREALEHSIMSGKPSYYNYIMCKRALQTKSSIINQFASIALFDRIIKRKVSNEQESFLSLSPPW